MTGEGPDNQQLVGPVRHLDAPTGSPRVYLGITPVHRPEFRTESGPTTGGRITRSREQAQAGFGDHALSGEPDCRPWRRKCGASGPSMGG